MFFVFLDDYSKYTWAYFIHEMSDVFDVFETLCICLKHEKGEDIGKIILIWSNHAIEFKKSNFSYLCIAKGIAHKSYSPITPQKNEIIERKNHTL